MVGAIKHAIEKQVLTSKSTIVPLTLKKHFYPSNTKSSTICCLSEDTRCRAKYQKLRRILRGERENKVECLHGTVGKGCAREGRFAWH